MWKWLKKNFSLLFERGAKCRAGTLYRTRSCFGCYLHKLVHGLACKLSLLSRRNTLELRPDVKGRHRTSKDVKERQRTSKDVKGRQRTSKDVKGRQRTSKDVKERQKTSKLSFHLKEILYSRSNKFHTLQCEHLFPMLFHRNYFLPVLNLTHFRLVAPASMKHSVSVPFSFHFLFSSRVEKHLNPYPNILTEKMTIRFRKRS